MNIGGVRSSVREQTSWNFEERSSRESTTKKYWHKELLTQMILDH